MVVSLEGVGGAEPAPFDGALDLVGGRVVLRVHVIQGSLHDRFRGHHLQYERKQENYFTLKCEHASEDSQQDKSN